MNIAVPTVPQGTELSPASFDRASLLERYRHLRKLNQRHHSQIIKLITGDAFLSQARRLGMARGKQVILDRPDDTNFVFDLLIYTSTKDRSRAIDRYIRSVQFASDSDERLMAGAMQNDRFAVVRCEGRHPQMGLILRDICRGVDFWLMDEGLENSLPIGAMMATRVYAVEHFHMTAGVLVPLDMDFLQEILMQTPQLMRKPPIELVDDRRFAEAIYKAAFAEGRFNQIAYTED